MISVIIPALNAEARLAAALASLVPAVVDGIVREVIVVDGGSTDQTLKIADAAGATLVHSETGRGRQLMAGAGHARFPWLLFLHADTQLVPGWEREATAFIARIDAGEHPPAAAAFRFSLDDLGVWPRLIEKGVAARCRLFKLPYGDQGLLLPASLYRDIGGYRPLPLMEDVDLVRRLGRQRIVILRSPAITSAARYRRSGYPLRVARNLSCLGLYYLRVPLQSIARLYG